MLKVCRHFGIYYRQGGVVLNRFTEKIHDKGFVIKEFCEYWGMSRRTYERMTANPDKHDKLNKMIEGMK